MPREAGGRRIEIEGIGVVLFRRSRRAKRIRISIQDPERITVAVPYGASFDRARAFTTSKREWILKQRARLHRTPVLDPKMLQDPKAAGENLLLRLEALSHLHGLPYRRASIRNQTSRWASCSPKNNISLNLRLALLPEPLVDYVLIHELVHTRIKNHGIQFWEMLEGRLHGARLLDKELRKFRLM